MMTVLAQQLWQIKQQLLLPSYKPWLLQWQQLYFTSLQCCSQWRFMLLHRFFVSLTDLWRVEQETSDQITSGKHDYVCDPLRCLCGIPYLNSSISGSLISDVLLLVVSHTTEMISHRRTWNLDAINAGLTSVPDWQRWKKTKQNKKNPHPPLFTGNGLVRPTLPDQVFE